jgi:outer membrane lipoprotein-sorting protein
MRKSLLRKIGIFFIPLLILGLSDVVLSITVEEVLNNFREKYKETKNFSADFEQTSLVAGRKRVAVGELNFQKPNLLRERYFDPNNRETTTQLIISDGQILWSYTPLINQVTKQEFIYDENTMELFPGFGRSLENIEKNYSLSFVEDKLAEKKGIHVVELVPKKLNDASDPMFDFIQVWLRDKDSVPVQFMYKNKKNDMTIVLSFKNIKINENLDESIFKFQVPKGVQVITVPNK